MKEYFTGFFTAMIFTVSLFLFVGAKKNNEKDLVVNSISVINPSNSQKTRIEGGKITILNKRNKVKGIFATEERSGYLYLMNHNNRKIFRSGAIYGDGHGGDGFLFLGNQYGDYGWSVSGKESADHYK